MKERENRIFSEWKALVDRESSAIFVADGVVDEEGWSNAKVKVLYLLREVNGADDEWDERDYLANYNVKESYVNTHSPTIDVLIRWQFGIMDHGVSSWKDVETRLHNKDLQSELLKQVCVVNIKKTAGSGVVDWDQFDTYFANLSNREFLKRQLSLYDPHIVICGGTAWHLCQIYGWNYNEWLQTARGIRYYQDAGITYIEFCHPNNRGPKNMIYYALIDALQELGIL